jgi:hypothetical protein
VQRTGGVKTGTKGPRERGTDGAEKRGPFDFAQGRLRERGSEGARERRSRDPHSTPVVRPSGRSPLRAGFRTSLRAGFGTEGTRERGSDSGLRFVHGMSMRRKGEIIGKLGE